MMNQYLRNYQQKGVQFLYHHCLTGQGAILCDDMGLGKTVQVSGIVLIYTIEYQVSAQANM